MKRVQIHLSTLLVLSLVASTVVGLNLRRYQVSFCTFSHEGDRHAATVTGYTAQGWPFAWQKWPSLCEVPSAEPYVFAADVAVCLVVLVTLYLVLERGRLFAGAVVQRLLR